MANNEPMYVVVSNEVLPLLVNRFFVNDGNHKARLISVDNNCVTLCVGKSGYTVGNVNPYEYMTVSEFTLKYKLMVPPYKEMSNLRGSKKHLPVPDHVWGEIHAACRRIQNKPTLTLRRVDTLRRFIISRIPHALRTKAMYISINKLIGQIFGYRDLHVMQTIAESCIQPNTIMLTRSERNAFRAGLYVINYCWLP